MNTTAASTTLGLLTARSLSNDASGRKFFRILADTAPFLLPKKYDFKEPIRSDFDIDDLRQPLKIWAGSQHACFLWRSSHPSALGSYWTAHKRHPVDTIYLNIRGRNYPSDALTSVILALAAAYQPLIAYVNRTYTGDLDDRQKYETHVMPLDEGITLHALKRGMPTVPWAWILGPEYVGMFTQEKLMSAPVFRHLCSSDYTYLQLTEALDLGEKDYEQYDGKRQLVIEQLGTAAFASKSNKAVKLPAFVSTLPV